MRIVRRFAVLVAWLCVLWVASCSTPPATGSPGVWDIATWDEGRWQ